MATLPISPFQTLNAKYDIVKNAILLRSPVSAIYDGRVRLLCPHVLGESGAGRLQALFYQFAGESSRGIEPDGSPANWRCLALEKLHSVRPIDGRWHTAPNHSRPQTCVRMIHWEVLY
jgi:hypothetical protein